MSGIEVWRDFIETFVDIFDGAFEFCLLFVYKVGYSKPMERLIFGMYYV